MANKVNTKEYARKGYLNLFDMPTKKDYRKQTHKDRLEKWVKEKSK